MRIKRYFEFAQQLLLSPLAASTPFYTVHSTTTWENNSPSHASYNSSRCLSVSTRSGNHMPFQITTSALTASLQAPIVAYTGGGVATLTCALNNSTILLSDAVTSGWSGPRVFSCMSSDLFKSASASPYLPCVAMTEVGVLFCKNHHVTRGN